jgi:hypothetical protein
MFSPLLVDILAYWNFNDDGSGGVSLLDSTGNNYTLTNYGATLASGVGGDSSANIANGSYLTAPITFPNNADFTINFWFNTQSFDGSHFFGDVFGNGILFAPNSDNSFGFSVAGANSGYQTTQSSASYSNNTWYNINLEYASGVASIYVNATQDGSMEQSAGPATGNVVGIGSEPNGAYACSNANIQYLGIWTRALSPDEITSLYNNGLGKTYPFLQTPTSYLYYNNAQNDGDWGNLLNWWQDSGFTTQAVALPTATNPINLYNQVTQNTQGADQCFCASASFWSANFGAGLTLQASGVVNMQGTSVLAGHTTDGVSMHDSSQLAATSVVDGNVTMRDSSRAFGSILGNATIYYDGGNGQHPIGGTVAGSVTYLGWPAVSPQWFNDQATGGGNNGDFSDLENWWSDDTYTTRPLSPITGQQYLPDASTDVFIAPNTGITSNSGTANPTVNSVTANNSNIQNISLTATNGFLFSGNEGAENATLYGSVTFQDTAYNYNSVIQGTATYKSAASLQNSWNQNSLGNLNSGASVGSTGFVVKISGGGGFISRLLHLPWFINL